LIPRPNIVFLVNGGLASAMGIRARSLAERLETEFSIEIAYRSDSKVYSILSFFGLLLRVRPQLCYVFDMAFSGVIAGGYAGPPVPPGYPAWTDRL